MDLRNRDVYSAIIFATTICILLFTFIHPRQVQVIIGEGIVSYPRISPYYTLPDCLIIAFGSFLLGATVSHFLMVRFSSPEKQTGLILGEKSDDTGIQVPEHPDPDEIMVTSRKGPQYDPEDTVPSESVHSDADTSPASYQRELLRLLKGNEQKIVRALIEEGTMNQTELSGRTEIPKSTLSRTLQGLEARGVVYRYDDGMSKMVKLQNRH